MGGHTAVKKKHLAEVIESKGYRVEKDVHDAQMLQGQLQFRCKNVFVGIRFSRA